jgi:hypothetical protein
MTHTCPKCHHADLHCHAMVRAVLHSCKDTTGNIQLSLLDWDQIDHIETYECLSCGHNFCGEESEA